MKKLVALFGLLVCFGVIAKDSKPLPRSSRNVEVAVAPELLEPALDVFIRCAREWGERELRDPDGADYDFSSSQIERIVNGSSGSWRFRFRVNARNGYGGFSGWQNRTLRIFDDGRYLVQ